MAQRSKGSGRVIIYIALILILVLAVLAFMFKDRLASSIGQQPPANVPAATAEPMVTVVFTAQAIPRGAIISSDELVSRPFPKAEYDSAQGVYFDTVDQLVGKVAKVDLPAQIIVTKNLVVDNGSLNAQEIPAGMVAISIPLQNRLSSISYAPQAGDHVNILAALTFVDLDTNSQTVLPDKVGQVTAPSAGGPSPVPEPPDLTAKVTTDGTNTQGTAVLDPSLQQPLYTYPSETQRPRLVSQTLVQDAIVLGVGNFLLPSQVAAAAAPTPTPGPNGQTAPTITYPDTITLIVAPQDAVTLNYLIYAGAELTLVLRGSGDTQNVQTEAVTLQYLMSQYNIPDPSKLAYGTDPRTDMGSPIVPLQLDPRYNIP